MGLSGFYVSSPNLNVEVELTSLSFWIALRANVLLDIEKQNKVIHTLKRGPSMGCVSYRDYSYAID